ncbi:hypothetical protein SAMN04488066_10968 [Halorubrum aquaticum]|uniref:Uncharacterized protein n=1 Tax=Halorubrum aquaticum TaxID=387340 RepID=A0A1I3B470_9EURY|nr:hypothetical protein [Halorubrum aquaticum]SFH57022.1 hypothetical protein SAMN04488066_10968 [Halorubrum aquaticum]
MEPITPARTVAICCLVLLVATAAVPGGVAATTPDPTEGTADPSDGTADREVGPLTECFAGDGYPLAIGDPPATIDALVHVSVLTDPAAGDEFGVELAGTLEGEPVVTLAAGVRLNAPGLIATGIDPFAAFDLLYAYELRLSMFDGGIDDTAYDEDRPPVGSAAGAVPC